MRDTSIYFRNLALVSWIGTRAFYFCSVERVGS